MKDGGPAFPIPIEAIGQNETFNIISSGGASLRDLFAGLALVGVCACPDVPLTPATAKMVYGMADAMLAEREKP